jgi:hypothetical protein
VSDVEVERTRPRGPVTIVGARPITVVLAAALAGVLAGVLAGCGVPIPTEVPDTSAPRDGGIGAGDPIDRLVADDDGANVLAAQLGTIALLVRDVETRLDAAALAAAAGDMDASRAEGATAVGLMLGVGGGGDGLGLVPAIEPDRGGVGSDDLTTALITSAGDVGGERSRLVLELVRDPMLGDLGAWQRDPVGVISVLRSAVDASDDTAALDASLLELPGELTRALGFAFAVASSDDPALSAHAARQAVGRLGVVLVAVELAVETLEARG